MLPWPELSFEVSLSVFVLYSVFYCSCLLVVFLAMSASGEALVSMPSLGGLGGFFFFKVCPRV